MLKLGFMGVMLFCMLFGIFPYVSVGDSAYKRVISGRIQVLLKHWKLERISMAVPPAVDLISKLIAPAEVRLNLDGILQHPWVMLDD